MVSLLDLKQAARVVKNENSKPVVQVPLEVWEGVMGEVPEPEQLELSQAEQIMALLKT